MVDVPALKALRIYISDENLKISNTYPEIEELWEIGKKYGVDAFLDGSCTRTDNGDIILNLKMVANRSGEIVWSESFINDKLNRKDILLPVKISTSFSLGLYPFKYHYRTTDTSTSVPVTPTAAAAEDTSLMLSAMSINFYLYEATSLVRRAFFDIHGGFDLLMPMRNTLSDTLPVEVPVLMAIDVGMEVIGIIFPKKNSNYGYWLAVYTGLDAKFVFQALSVVLYSPVGLRSQFTKHFSLGAGINYIFLNNVLDIKTLTDPDDKLSFELSNIGFKFDVFVNF